MWSSKRKKAAERRGENLNFYNLRETMNEVLRLEHIKEPSNEVASSSPRKQYSMIEWNKLDLRKKC